MGTLDDYIEMFEQQNPRVVGIGASALPNLASYLAECDTSEPDGPLQPPKPIPKTRTPPPAPSRAIPGEDRGAEYYEYLLGPLHRSMVVQRPLDACLAPINRFELIARHHRSLPSGLPPSLETRIPGHRLLDSPPPARSPTAAAASRLEASRAEAHDRMLRSVRESLRVEASDARDPDDADVDLSVSSGGEGSPSAARPSPATPPPEYRSVRSAALAALRDEMRETLAAAGASSKLGRKPARAGKPRVESHATPPPLPTPPQPVEKAPEGSLVIRNAVAENAPLLREIRDLLVSLQATREQASDKGAADVDTKSGQTVPKQAAVADTKSSPGVPTRANDADAKSVRGIPKRAEPTPAVPSPAQPGRSEQGPVQPGRSEQSPARPSRSGNSSFGVRLKTHQSPVRSPTRRHRRPRASARRLVLDPDDPRWQRSHLASCSECQRDAKDANTPATVRVECYSRAKARVILCPPTSPMASPLQPIPKPASTAPPASRGTPDSALRAVTQRFIRPRARATPLSAAATPVMRRGRITFTPSPPQNTKVGAPQPEAEVYDEDPELNASLQASLSHIRALRDLLASEAPL